jgi:antitoxin HicB
VTFLTNRKTGTCRELIDGGYITAKAAKRRVSLDSFDDFLESEGTLAEAEDVTIKRVLAWQIAEGMKAKGITKTVMASRMKTDRRQLDCLLDLENRLLTRSTLRQAATALGHELYVENWVKWEIKTGKVLFI